MSALDVIELPGSPGHYGRRVLVEAWQAAGSPPVNSAGRLYGPQKAAWDAYQTGTGSPADNPDDESQRLAHVRFVALDITPTAERIRRLEAAGLYRPYSYEPWHWELPNVRAYALVRTIPTALPESKEDEVKYLYVDNDGNGKPVWVLVNSRTAKFVTTYEQKAANGWATVWGHARSVTRQEFLNALDAIRKTA